MLVSGGPVTPSGPAENNTDRRKWLAFTDALHSYGWLEGRNASIEWRSWYQHEESLPHILSELTALPVDVIVSDNTTGTRAAENATASVPIVFASGGDPVALGLVDSIAHPGRNATGIASDLNELTIKGVDLLRDLNPGLTRVANLSDLSNAANATGARYIGQALEAAGIQWLSLDMRTQADVQPAFDSAASWGAQAMIARVGGMIPDDLVQQIIQLAAINRLPAVYTNRDDQPVKMGGLAAYFVAADQAYRRCAYFVDRILRDANPADLPVEHVDTFSLAINRTTAASPGMTIPSTVAVLVTETVD